MSFLSLIGIEFMKVKRSKILFIFLLAAIALWLPAIFNARLSFEMDHVGISPENNFFIQSLLGFAWFLYPASMAAGTLLLRQIEQKNKGYLKMLALPVSTNKLSMAKFIVLLSLAAIQTGMAVVLYFISAAIVSQTENYPFILSPLFVLKEASLLYFSSIPMLAVFWMFSVYMKKAIFAIGACLGSIVPSIIMINTKIWYIYPMCYPFYIINSEYGKLAANLSSAEINMLLFIPIALLLTMISLALSAKQFWKAERI